MKVQVLGAGFYGCHIALSLLEDGHDVELHEARSSIFQGASGGIPARMHQGQHYPRSGLTRIACQQHHEGFMERYGDLTEGVRTNVYAIAKDSMVDYYTYCKILRDEIEFVQILRPEEFGLKNVEGAILTGERHIVLSRAKEYFEKHLAGVIRFGSTGGATEAYDLTVDCTFCANDSANIDRYEPCLTVILAGPTDTAVTIMDGPFPSLYPWDNGLCSLTSAKWTPFTRECKTWQQAQDMLSNLSDADVRRQAQSMIEQMSYYYPAVLDFDVHDFKLTVRAMPKSNSDARLVDVVQTSPGILRVRAGKIDAILHAYDLVKRHL